MKLSNPLLHLASSIRFGFATNSSSSHSILLLSEQGVSALAASNGESEDGEDTLSKDGEYGWEWFELVRSKDKLDYIWTDLVGQVNHALRPDVRVNSWMLEKVLGDLPNATKSMYDFAKSFTTKVLDHEPKYLVKTEGEVQGLDHDSCFSFPIDKSTGLPHVEFARWFRNRVLNPNVVVFGGNDNEEDPPGKPSGKDVRAPLTDDEYSTPMTCFDRGTHWLLWEKSDGTKLRVPKNEGDEILYSDVPELLDVCLTAKCSFGCAFCYQDSTPEGKHPTMKAHEIVDTILKTGALEVAIGGGEPLEYPEFWDIVQRLENSIVVNVTTRRPDLIPIYKLNKFGSIGYSAESSKVVVKMLGKLGLTGKDDDYENPWLKKLVLHVVLGSTPVDEIMELCRLAQKYNLEVLLLAYKTDGRGKDFTPFPHDDWVDAIKRKFWHRKLQYYTGPKLGADTPTVEKWGKELAEKLKVNPKLMSQGEGQFSLYIDFVNETFSRASYGQAGSEKIKLKPSKKSYGVGEDHAKQILTEFKEWHTFFEQLRHIPTDSK